MSASGAGAVTEAASSLVILKYLEDVHRFTLSGPLKNGFMIDKPR